MSLARIDRTASRHGFTLIELLVVSAIIALLIAILLPSLSKVRRMSAVAGCMANLRGIGLGMSAYALANQGWLPAGPSDQLSWVNIDRDPSNPETSDVPRDGGNWRPALKNEWQWGGRRGKYLYLENAGGQRVPETVHRPLTRYIYPRSSLDRDVPMFRCPADNGLDYWDLVHQKDWAVQGIGRLSIYETTGNSYYVQLAGGTVDDPTELHAARKQPARVVLAHEAIFYYDKLFWSQPGKVIPGKIRTREQKGWHGTTRMYKVSFMDGHAESRQFAGLRSGMNSGNNWFLVNYHYLVDWYR